MAVPGVVSAWAGHSILTMRNRGLDAGFMVKMPVNYILMDSSLARNKTGKGAGKGR